MLWLRHVVGLVIRCMTHMLAIMDSILMLYNNSEKNTEMLFLRQFYI